MNSIKCKNCGLTNFASETECRRCGNPFAQSAQSKRTDKPPRRFSLTTFVIFALAAGVVYYFYLGMQQSVSEVNANDANRVASQPAQQQPAGLSRTQYDRQRAGQVGTAIQNSNSLVESQRHNEETQKALQASQGAPQK